MTARGPRRGAYTCIMHLAAGVALVAAPGCDDKKPLARDVPPSPPSAVAERLGLDAASLVDPADPPAPAGDLKAEIDAFAGVDACVKQRAALDPLLGDALGAIGYDTFVRDACRLLDAAHDKNADRCERIDSGALRARCRSWVAMIAATADTCPLALPGVPARGREPTCLAVAGRDPRMCQGVVRAADRAACVALVHRDPERCPPGGAACAREVTRWKGVLREPLSGLAKLPEVKGKLAVRGQSGTADPAQTELDARPDLDAGVVVVTAGERARVEVGAVDVAERTRFGGSPNRPPRFGVVVVLEPEIDPKKLRATLERVELDVPGQATLVTPEAKCDCRVVASHLDKTRGGLLSLTIEGTFSAGAKAYGVRYEVSTFVRDVLPDSAGERRTLTPSLGAATPSPGAATPRATDASTP